MQTKKNLKTFLCSRNLFKAAKPLGQDPIELGAQHGNSQDDGGIDVLQQHLRTNITIYK